MANKGGTFVEDGFGEWLDGVGDTATDRAAATFEMYADLIREDAQANAPWSDRTGEARSGIIAEVDQNEGEIVLSLAHTVEYGIWLETIQNGDLAILLPTLEKWAFQVFADAGGEIIGTREGGL
jgi:hypothetical protein